MYMHAVTSDAVTCATSHAGMTLTKAGSTLSVNPLCDTSYAIKETWFSVCVRLYGQQLVKNTTETVV